jgi:hypothetical protein
MEITAIERMDTGTTRITPDEPAFRLLLEFSANCHGRRAWICTTTLTGEVDILASERYAWPDVYIYDPLPV